MIAELFNSERCCTVTVYQLEDYAIIRRSNFGLVKETKQIYPSQIFSSVSV